MAASSGATVATPRADQPAPTSTPGQPEADKAKAGPDAPAAAPLAVPTYEVTPTQAELDEIKDPGGAARSRMMLPAPAARYQTR